MVEAAGGASAVGCRFVAGAGSGGSAAVAACGMVTAVGADGSSAGGVDCKYLGDGGGHDAVASSSDGDDDGGCGEGESGVVDADEIAVGSVGDGGWPSVAADDGSVAAAAAAWSCPGVAARGGCWSTATGRRASTRASSSNCSRTDRRHWAQGRRAHCSS